MNSEYKLRQQEKQLQTDELREKQTALEFSVPRRSYCVTTRLRSKFRAIAERLNESLANDFRKPAKSWWKRFASGD